VQINDAPAEPQPDLMHETMNARLLPGAGDFDLIGMIRTLEQIGSAAPIGVEVFSTGLASQPIDSIARSWARAAEALLQQARHDNEQS
jgi:sugar phosphate isomerase/epimerase